MKNKPLILGTLAVAMLVATGCDKSRPTDEYSNQSDTNRSTSEQMNETATNAWQKTKEATTNAVANMKEGTTNAWANLKESVQSLGDYSYDKKSDFVASAGADLKALDQKIDDLSAKVANSSESVKANAQEKWQDLKAKRTVASQKLENVKNATAANWETAKEGFKDAYDSLKDSVKNAW